ncbi:MAG: gliding motility-associated C-terminal domain-containing protein [bacterium]|nr:gliding motility-associated C-terminal domain-containing protein [bacterium]
MIQKRWWLILLLICLSGCIPGGFIITDEAEDVSDEGPQLTITASPDPVPALEMITITITSDKLLVNPPTVIITQHYERKGIDITQSMETTDQLAWQGTYTVKSGYEGSAVIEVFNAFDEDGNKGYGTASFEVIMPEEGDVSEEEMVEEGEEGEESEEKETEEEAEYEEVMWHDIRGEYGKTGAAQAPMLTTQKKVSNNIKCIAADDENIWFGTNDGIGQYNRLTQSWKGFFNKKGGLGNSIHCLAIDDNIVWFGSHGDGLFRYQNSTGKWLASPATNNLLDPNINDILIVNNIVWVATDHGLAKYDTLSKQWIFYTLQTTYHQLISEKITKLAWLYPHLWVGTDRGLMSYDPLSDVWQNQTAICSRNIACLFMNQNDLWIGTPDSGIIQHDTINNGTKTYTISNGLYSNSALSLKADTSHVFVGHSGGMSELDKSTDIWMSFTHTKIGDIIRSLDDVQAIHLEDNGSPWIGMNTGLIDISQSEIMEVVEPIIIELNPVMDAVLSTTYLEVTAKYEDNIGGSGINPFAVLLWIDGVQVHGTATSQNICYKATSTLTEGEHSIELQVADNCGNIIVQKNTFSIALPELSYKLLVPQVYVKPSGELSVTIDASEKLKATPTASLSCAEILRFTDITGGKASLSAPKVMENGTETGTSIAFGSWTTTDRKKWIGTVIVPINAIGIGTITVGSFEDVHGRKSNEKVNSVKVVRRDDAGVIAPIAPQITSLATSTIASVTTITGTATPNTFVNLMVAGKIFRTVRADNAGNFTFKNVPITATITTAAIDKARIASEVSEINVTPAMLVDFPRLVSTKIKVRGIANQTIGTVSGNLLYDYGSVTLSMVIGENNLGWIGTASIPSGVEGMGTLTIFGTDNQKALFIGRLMIDTNPPGTPTITVAKISERGDWRIYGTATGADVVELRDEQLGKQRLYGTTTPQNSRYAFEAIPVGTTALRVVSVDNAGNRTHSETIVIYPSLRIFAINMPKLASTMLEVLGSANHAIGTISGYVSYGKGTVTLNMAVANLIGTADDGRGWVGSASIPAGVDGMGTVSIFATDIYNQQATFIGTLTIDTTPPETPTIAATYTAKAGWLVYGTATGATMVELWDNKGLVGTATPSKNGDFTIKARQQSIGTTTVWAESIDKAGNQAKSRPLDIPAPLRLFGNLPQLVSIMLDVRGGANHVIGTISGYVSYGRGTVALNMAGDGQGWTGSATIPAGVDSTGTVTIFATDIYNQQAAFIGTLTIDTISPATPTIAATYTVTNDWIVYGTATEAVVVELIVNEQSSGTTTPSVTGTFSFVLTGDFAEPIIVCAVSIDRAGNQSLSDSIPLQMIFAAPTIPAANILSNDGGTITISGKQGPITLKIPTDVLDRDSQITITEIAKTAGKLSIANFNARYEKHMTPLQDSCISLACTHQADGKPIYSTKQAMKLCLPYADDNHDGIVDETAIRAETLRIFKLNEASNRWNMLADSYPVAVKCEVWANIYEFGIYAIIPYEQANSLADVKAYPNPFYPNIGQICWFSPSPPGRYTISIYNSAGEQVKILRQDNKWEGDNDKGNPVASGIYFYLIKNANEKQTGKIGLIR